MSEQPNELEMKPGEYRRIFNGPLEKRSTLILCMIFFGATSLGGAWAAFAIGTLWAAFIPIPTAFAFGLAAAGMWPNWWFGRDN